MNGMALCSGIGGIDLGLALAMPAYRTVVHVEREAFCVSVLAARMAEGRLPDAPIWSDLATFDGRPWRGVVDIVTGGYPCQPFSCAGRRLGTSDPRHLWPHIARILGEVQPTFALFENVLGHVSLGLREVCADLRDLGYAVSAGTFSAWELGAPHVRERLFILAARGGPVADATGARRRTRQPVPSREVRDAARRTQPQRRGGAVADTEHRGRRAAAAGGVALGGPHDGLPAGRDEVCGGPGDRGREVADAGPRGRPAARAAQPALGLPDDGDARGLVVPAVESWPTHWEGGTPREVPSYPGRSDEIRALGNAVVPAVAALAWRTLLAEHAGVA